MKPLLYALLLLLLTTSNCYSQQSADYSASTYRATLRHLAARREGLAARYRQAASPAARTACLAEARELWLTALDSTVFPAWEGTPWTFYGQSWEPRQGTIACGYFVTTSLHHTGLKLQRTLLAKQTSENIIKNLTTEGHILRFRGTSQPEFLRQVRAQGPGLYVVGLDFHVAFLRVRAGGAVQMVHSSYLHSVGVVREAADDNPALASNYRVLGKVSADDALVRAWLLGQPLVAHGKLVKS
jgi:hypothetical protein